MIILSFCVAFIGFVLMFRFVKYWYELRKTLRFKNTLEKFYALESDIRSINGNNEYLIGEDVRVHQLRIHKQCKAKYKAEYDQLRTEVAESLPAIRRIAKGLGVHCFRESLPPPRVGGAIIPVCIFESALEDLGYVETQYETRFDTLNKFNPFTWLNMALQTPFVLIKTTGFNTDKIENGLWGVGFKTVSLIFLIWLCLGWGFEPKHLTGIFRQ